MGFDYKLLIDGQMVDGDLTMDVINPATENVVASCPRGSERQLNEAIVAAKAAFPAWSQFPPAGRKAMLLTVANAIEKHGTEIARILTQEQGKPLPDATQETAWCVAFIRYFASLELPAGEIRVTGGSRVELHRRPLGVVGAILPWNFPVLLLAFKIPALLAGNTMVIKPAPTTPLSTLMIGSLIRDILPPGVVNIVTDANDLGGVLTAHPDVRKVSFTGSVATGKRVMASAAETLKRITLELGGNDAGIVLGDVDPKDTAQKLFQGAFWNNGQVCIALKRLYVHESIYDEICDEMATLANQAVVGDGLQQGVQLGPIQNRAQYEKVKELLEDTKKHGKIIAGGAALDQPGYFIQPTIVRDISDGTRLVDEEQFGPILPLIKFSDPEDALRRANNSSYGLGGSIWSKDLEKAYDLASRMNSGTVWVNKHGDIAPDIPFGGAKQSGLGTELGQIGLEEFTQLQVINVGL
jgi:acyl-CoA reductase-like NAD-dependent aldehyde dehydrogenase